MFFAYNFQLMKKDASNFMKSNILISCCIRNKKKW